MSILDQIKADQLAARKARETVKATLLTTLIGEATFVSDQDYKAGKTEITDDKVLATIRKFLKGATETHRILKDSLQHAENYENENDMIKVFEVALKNAETEISILEAYLPPQMSEDDLRALIKLFKDANAGANVGAIMAHLKANYNGLYDSKLASALAK